MATFVDGAGREWGINLTLGMVKRLKPLGVDVGLAVGGVGQVTDAAFRDPETAGKVLWTLCEAQAKEAGVSPEQFADAMTGPALAGAADALSEAVVCFSHRPEATPKLLAMLRELRVAATTDWIAKLNAIRAEQASISNGSAGGPPDTAAAATPSA